MPTIGLSITTSLDVDEAGGADSIRTGGGAAALGGAAVTGGAIVAEQGAAGLTHDRHQARIGLDRRELGGVDLRLPGRAIERRALQRLRNRLEPAEHDAAPERAVEPVTKRTSGLLRLHRREVCHGAP